MLTLRQAKARVGAPLPTQHSWEGLTTAGGQALADHVCKCLGLPKVRVLYSRRYTSFRAGTYWETPVRRVRGKYVRNAVGALVTVRPASRIVGSPRIILYRYGLGTLIHELAHHRHRTGARYACDDGYTHGRGFEAAFSDVQQVFLNLLFTK